MNVAKSKFGALPRESETLTFEECCGPVVKGFWHDRQPITMRDEVVDRQGNKHVFGFSGYMDGKDYPYTGQEPGGAETISLEALGKSAYDATSKKGGKVLFRTFFSFSKHDTVMTLETSGKTASGQSAKSKLVFDRVGYPLPRVTSLVHSR